MDAEYNCSLSIEEFSLENVTLPSEPIGFIQVDVRDELQPYVADDIFEDIQFPFARTKVQSVPIKTSKILIKNDLKNVIEITLDVSKIGCDYMPGDTVGIIPENNEKQVKLVLNSIQLTSEADRICDISILPGKTKKKVKIPVYLKSRTTPRQLLTHFLNIRAVPKKLFIRSLVEFTTNDIERQFLKTLCSKEGSQFYTKLLNDSSLIFLDILKLCPSCRPSLALLIEHLPRLQPRPYSIANSSLLTPTDIRLIFSVRQSNPGLTTNYLANLAELSIAKPSAVQNVNLYFRNINKFRFTETEYSSHLIMVSVGCAIAPFLGFLEHKKQLQSDPQYKNPGETWLITGFTSKENALYQTELEELKKAGILTKHVQCFSRDPGAQYKYVTDAIKGDQQQFLDTFLHNNSILFVCADGGAEISKGIQKTIREISVEICNGDSQRCGEGLIEKSIEFFKYREDIWSEN